MAKKTARERDRDSMTQYEFISKFPPDTVLSISELAQVVGGEYSNIRARCRRYLELGHLTSHETPQKGRGGKQLLSYELSSEKKTELITRIREYGSLPSTKKRAVPKKDHVLHHKLTTPENLAERDRIYNLIVGNSYGR